MTFLRVALLGLMVLTLPLDALELEDYPVTDRLLLGSLPVRVAPNREMTLQASSSGTLTLFVDPAQKHFERGTVLGGIDLERIEMERELLELAEALLNEKELPEWQVQKEQTATQLTGSLAKARSERALLERLVENPDISASFLDTTQGSDQDNTAALQTLLVQAEEKIELVSEHLDFVQSTRYQELEETFRRKKLAHQRANLEKRLDSAYLTMPFEGEVNFLVPVPQGVEAIPVQANVELVTIRDMTQIIAQTPVEQTHWRTFPKDKLVLEVGAAGNRIMGAYRGERVVTLSGRETLIYDFAFAGPLREQVRPYLGGAVNGRLYFQLPRQGRLLPKLELVRMWPDAFREGGWHAVVAQAFPGHEVLAVGESSIVIAREEQ